MGPIHETIFVVSDSTRSRFGDWLQRTRELLASDPGCQDSLAYASPEDPNRFVLLVTVADDTALDELQDGVLADAFVELSERFGNSVRADNRVLREDQQDAVIDHLNCLNCGARLTGQYCAYCGQRARSRLISLWQLTREAFGDLFELDSRLWRTLIPLLLRPGLLTRDYLEGRRARYMPPFRTYLVLSVLFFVVAFFDPREDLSLLFEPEPPPAAEDIDAADTELDENLEEARERIENAIEEGDLTEEQADIALAAIENDSMPIVNIDGSLDDGLSINYNDETEECEVSGVDSLPDWLRSRLTLERIKTTCESIAADRGSYFLDLLLDNAPIALIVLLPLMALVLKTLYPLSRRYFVEHLLFFIHFHAFFFLILTLEILYSDIAGAIGLPDYVIVIPNVVASLYIPVYLYKSMRRVYTQGHIVTLFKYVLLLTAYAFGMMLTIIGAALFALLAI